MSGLYTSRQLQNHMLGNRRQRCRFPEVVLSNEETQLLCAMNKDLLASGGRLMTIKDLRKMLTRGL